ncbi:ABC transporter substrate-binding protein [Campylobacter sp. FMV-PI01]|uniref:ABC transporter substrate-binding protein n=1 Tax=Campylobacter portucalensis TaxID=2608384 RepID=A0A6L5WIL4_9BACT|nr:ABC transporter substrate-binding protein [Campylobacter portucalensis]
MFLNLVASRELDKSHFCINCENLKPQNIKKVYASNPALLYQLYAIDKSKIAGLVFEFWDLEKKYLDKNVTSLPVVGGFFGQGKTPNIEQVLNLKPDLIISSTNTTELYKDIFSKSKIPILYINALTLEENLNSFQILGEILGANERSKELHKYGLETLELAKEISSKAKNKPKIYYAYGDNGLQTECDKSSFGVLVKIAGGKLIHKCENLKQNSRVNISFEKILDYNPDKIIVYHKSFYDKIFDDKKWQLLDAVKNKEVYLIPRKPFSWAGKPASFMRYLGIRWLLQIFHPKIANLDIHQEAKEFYKLFLYLNLNNNDLSDILNEKN